MREAYAVTYSNCRKINVFQITTWCNVYIDRSLHSIDHSISIYPCTNQQKNHQNNGLKNQICKCHKIEITFRCLWIFFRVFFSGVSHNNNFVFFILSSNIKSHLLNRIKRTTQLMNVETREEKEKNAFWRKNPIISDKRWTRGKYQITEPKNIYK